LDGVRQFLYTQHHSGIWGGIEGGTDSSGGDKRVEGGHPFIGERVGGVPLFSSGEEEYCHLEHFGALLGHKRHKNAQKSLIQAVWDHFELILGTFGNFSPLLLILVVSLPYRRKC
jgi:hypothetical protein